MKNRSTVGSLVAGAALLAVVVTGCGAQGGDRSAQQVSSGIAPRAQSAAYLSQAARTTAAVSSERFSLTVSTSPANGEPTYSVTSEGAVTADGRAQLKTDISGRSGEHSGAASIETIVDGDTVYLKAPFVEVFSEGKPWIKVTSDTFADVIESLDGSVQADPGSFLTFLEGAGGPVETLGTEAVRGVATRHVSVQIDPAKLLDQASAEQREQLEQHLKGRGVSLADLGPLPAEAWIDDDGYVRRFSTSYDLGKLDGLLDGESNAPGLNSTITETIELYDFDEPVDIEVPPASQVHEIDLSKLFGN